jgi:hypothetical protein
MTIFLCTHQLTNWLRFFDWLREVDQLIHPLRCLIVWLNDWLLWFDQLIHQFRCLADCCESISTVHLPVKVLGWLRWSVDPQDTKDVCFIAVNGSADPAVNMFHWLWWVYQLFRRFKCLIDCRVLTLISHLKVFDGQQLIDQLVHRFTCEIDCHELKQQLIHRVFDWLRIYTYAVRGWVWNNILALLQVLVLHG